MKKLIALAALLASSIACAGTPLTNLNPTTAVLPAYNQAWPNWSNAGLLSLGGIAAIDAARTTTCATVSPTGKTPPTSGDDADTINAAIASCAAGDVLVLSTGTFELDQSEYILLDKSITLRGSGTDTNCTTSYGSAPCWQTVINVYNGAIPDWEISATTAGANCGVTSSSVSACSQAAGAILMSPASNYNWSWDGCNLGATNPTTQGCGTTLTADAAQGALSVQVTSVSGFSAGMWVLIDESPQVVSTTNPVGNGQAAVEASSDWLSSSGSPATLRLEGGDIPGGYSFIGSGGGSEENQRLNEEIHQIAAIGTACPGGASTTLCFTTPLTLAFRQSGSHDARVYWPAAQNSTTYVPFLIEAGVENLSITKSANSGIQIAFCAYCFVSNVEVSNWIAGAVNANYSVRSDIEGSYFHDGADLENNGNEYPVGINSASTESLIANNIIVRGGKGMVGRAANTAVIAYNYADDTFYMQAVIGDYWVDMDITGSHYAGTHHFLFEGNWGDNCDNDETHGNAIYHTYFRNDCTGLRTPFTDPSYNYPTGTAVDDQTGLGHACNPPAGSCESNAPAPLRAAGPMAFDYWMAYVGNVLGTSGATTTANGWGYSGTSTKDIWLSGWTGSEWGYYPDPNLDGSNPYLFRHGDYDYVDGDIADWASGYSHTLPNSFYLISAPAFFTGANCSYPWPWVTPTASSPLQEPTGASCLATDGLPAKARWDAGTPFVQP